MDKTEKASEPRHARLAEHTPERIRQRLARTQHSYLADFIYGAIDGTVTTFAVVSGVAGAGLSSGIVIILGLANLVGDGFSMAASNYLGTRANAQLRDRARVREEHEIEVHPDGEREEIKQIYAIKGFDGEDLDRVVEVICAEKERWVNTMLTEELGLTLSHRSPVRAAAATLVAFIAVGFLPLLPFVAQLLSGQADNPFLWSSALTGIAFFSVGAAKSRFVEQHWFVAGGETLLLGGSAAALAYTVGHMLSGVTM